MNAAYVEFPFSAEDMFGKKGQVKIKASFDDKVEYRGSLAKMKSDCHILGLTQEVRKQLGKLLEMRFPFLLLKIRKSESLKLQRILLWSLMKIRKQKYYLIR
jgi:hypothetical protein